MAPGDSRPRSSTSVSTSSTRPRPVSRASTTSINTPIEVIDQPAQESQHVYQPADAHPELSTQSNGNHYTPEEMITRSKQQLTDPDRELAVDPSLQFHEPHSRAMSADTAWNGGSDAPRPALHHYHSLDGKENLSFPTINENKTQIGAAMLDAQKKPKGNASSQANDQELRRLYRENRHRDLKDVAASVLANERGPKSEKTKQIFAMNWLSTVCKKSNTSVPRNRVYAQYAQRCGTERVPLLNPASFGKLVRIIFPDITTRRLGMRGESKYHYVDLALVTDDLEAQQSAVAQPSAILFGAPVKATMQLPVPMPRTHIPADAAEFPPPKFIFEPRHPPPAPQPKTEAQGNLYLDRNLSGMHKGPSRPNMIRRRLRFPTQSESTVPDDAPIELPDLHSHLPAGTDADAAAALKALYRSHCVSVIDCVRFCKEKSFWHHFTSFHGTLTVPVQKLFSHPSVAPWIRECDWLMYQKMIQFVSPLALQVMPDVVTKAFQSISDNLGSHISSIFYSHPQHVRDAKHGPAVIFAGLLGRLLRVNAASHAAAHILGNDATRDQMWHDWVYHVKPTVVAETCLPGVGYSRCIQVLTNDIRDLLSPLAMTSYPGMQTIYDTASQDFNGSDSHFNDLDDSSTSSVLDRWVTFLHGLPSRFPNADARTLLHCVSDVGTAVLRDITMATAVSFGQWTVTKVWVDEMMQWLAEKGGFLENAPCSTEMRPKKRSAHDAGLEMNEGSTSRPRNSATDHVAAQGNRGNFDSFHHEKTTDSRASKNAFFNGISHQPTYVGYEKTHDGSYRPQEYHQTTQTQTSPDLPEHEQRKEAEHALRTETEQIQQQQASKPCADISIEPSLPAHIAKETEFENEDSGIGLDLELPQQQTSIRLADYGGFVANSTNSDPADVVVC